MTISGDKQYLKGILNNELQKYEVTQDDKYRISYNYVKCFLQTDDKKISQTYNLLMLNNDKYDFVTIDANYKMAVLLKDYNPQRAKVFLRKALEVEKASTKAYFLPHLYHLQGIFLYDERRYREAYYYFRLAEKNFKREDKLYLASMYNNYSLIYKKLGWKTHAISNAKKAIKILEDKKQLSADEIAFTFVVKRNLGDYYFGYKQYNDAIGMYSLCFDFYRRSPEFNPQLMDTARMLFTVYDHTGNSKNKKGLVDFLIKYEKNLRLTKDRVVLNQLLVNFYSDIDDLYNLKERSRVLSDLNSKLIRENEYSLKSLSSVYNSTILKDTQLEYDYKLEAEHLKNIISICTIVITTVLFIFLIILLLKSHQRKIDLAEKRNSDYLMRRKILEQDLALQNEKIKHLQQNINLKSETEKAFLIDLKKIRRNKNIETETLLKDLFVKINNLIQIDNKNYELHTESRLENAEFKRKLIDAEPSLTDRELKFCEYFRMGISSKEIALLENTSSGTVRVYKAKIKNKLKIAKDGTLEDYLRLL